MTEDAHQGWHYKDLLETIVQSGNKPSHVQAISKAVKDLGFDKRAIEERLKSYGYDCMSYYKDDLLDLMITYLYLILDDHYITKEEYRDFGLLKILFKIEEGDFYKKKYFQIQEIINDHLTYIIQDGEVSLSEALQTVDLQSMFSLSYDQYAEFEKHFNDKSKIVQSKAIIEIKSIEVGKPVQQIKSNLLSIPESNKTLNETLALNKKSKQEPVTYNYNYGISEKKKTDWSTVWGVVLFIILGLLVAFIKKSLKHH